MIEVSHLTKWYGRNKAVDDISFTIEQGHVYGFLGPNGAGKSTTMNIITGCLAATEGTVTVDGHDVFEESLEAKRAVGYLPEIPPLYGEMTPVEYLTFVAEAKRIPKAERTAAIDAVMEKTKITHVSGRLIRNLSKGYRQRVGIAQAILGSPKVVILDEPTVGLDPHQIIEIRDLIRELGRDHTVILSSHILQEISSVCDRVIIISGGRVVASDSIDRLTGGGEGVCVLRVDSRGTADRVRALLGSVGADTVRVTECIDHVHAEVEWNRKKDLREQVFRAYAGADVAILSMTAGERSLEDVFLELTESVSTRPAPKAADQTEEPDEEGPYSSLFSTASREGDETK